MPCLILTIGLPGAGKTTWAYKYMLEKHTSIKIDELLLFQIPGKNKAVGDIHRCFDFSDRIAKFLEKK